MLILYILLQALVNVSILLQHIGSALAYFYYAFFLVEAVSRALVGKLFISLLACTAGATDYNPPPPPTHHIEAALFTVQVECNLKNYQAKRNLRT
jgi:hypothetical protein